MDVFPGLLESVKVDRKALLLRPGLRALGSPWGSKHVDSPCISSGCSRHLQSSLGQADKDEFTLAQRYCGDQASWVLETTYATGE